MTTLAIVTGLIILLLYIATLRRNSINTFISGAVYRWYKAKDESNIIKPEVAKLLIESERFKAQKFLTLFLTLAWAALCVINGLWIYLATTPFGFIIAILAIKVLAKNFSVNRELSRASSVVSMKARKYRAHSLKADDIANNTPKYQLSNLDQLLENDEFINFALLVKDKHLG